MKTLDFDYHLPEHLIAQHPTTLRNKSKLLYLDGKTGNLADASFSDLPDFFNRDDLLIFNDTRVIKARLFGKKPTGGAVEVLIERLLDGQNALAHVGTSKSLKVGSYFILSNTEIQVEVTGRADNLFLLAFKTEMPLLDLLDQYGHLPLPPYITHLANKQDESRYQTVYAKHAGAVAAPTAGLHFDEEMLDLLKKKGVNFAFVTLHVGAGTFQPVKVDNIVDHKMHSERYTVPQLTADLINQTKASGNKVAAVGTTALRALESAARNQLSRNDILKAAQGETDIFITPGYEFKTIDRLITNFHLPKSTLLMLVSAFAGFENIKKAYSHAVQQEYRFFSFGDAMLLELSKRSDS